MMAFDSTASASTLAPSTIETLRASLSTSVARGNHGDDLHEVLCRAAEEARAKGIHAERLLVILKDVWHGLPRVSGASSTDAETVLLQELISRCIQEYYSL